MTNFPAPSSNLQVSADSITQQLSSSASNLQVSADSITQQLSSSASNLQASGLSIKIPSSFSPLEVRPIFSETGEVIKNADRLVIIGGLSTTATFPKFSDSVRIYSYGNQVSEMLLFVKDKSGRIVPYSALLEPPLSISNESGVVDVEFTKTIELFTGRVPSGLSGQIQPQR